MSGAMNVKKITVGIFATNCYLVSCPETGEGIVIDPGADGKRIVEKIKALDIKVKYIVNTHGHVDHIGANGKLKEELNVPVLLSSKDLDIYRNPGFGLRFVLGKQPEPDQFIKDGDYVSFGGLSLLIMETPGHTPGGMCLSGENTVFCGDTLFAGSVGRTDLTGGSYSALMKSIREQLANLPPETVVYPGHGPATTIGEEIASNPFIS